MLALEPVPPYIKVADVRHYFGWGKKKVWKLLADREIRGSRHGKEWLVSTKSIFQLLKRCENIKGEVNE